MKRIPPFFRIKSAVKVIVEQAELGNAIYMVLDSSPGTACPPIQTALHADFVFLVTELPLLFIIKKNLFNVI